MTVSEWITEFKKYYSGSTNFSDTELEVTLRESVSIIFGSSYTLETTPDSYQYQIFLLSKIRCIKNICEDAAKFFNYTEGISGDSVDKGKIFDNLLKLSESLLKDYENIYPSGLSSGSSSVGIQFVMTRVTE